MINYAFPFGSSVSLRGCWPAAGIDRGLWPPRAPVAKTRRLGEMYTFVTRSQPDKMYRYRDLPKDTLHGLAKFNYGTQVPVRILRDARDYILQCGNASRHRFTVLPFYFRHFISIDAKNLLPPHNYELKMNSSQQSGKYINK